jgi:WYL domain
MLLPGAKLKIDYLDGKEERTTRFVTFQEFGHTNDGKVYLVGFCHLRNEIRHFRVDRIQQFIYPDGTHINDNILASLTKNYDRQITHAKKINLDIEGCERHNTVIEDPLLIDAFERIGGFHPIATESQRNAAGKLGPAIPFLLSREQAHALLSARNFAEFTLEEVGFRSDDDRWLSARAQLITFIVADPSLRKRITQWSNRSFSRRGEGRPRPTRDAQVQQIIEKAAQLAATAARSAAAQPRQCARSALRIGAAPLPRQASFSAAGSSHPTHRSKNALWLLVAAVAVILAPFMSS